METIFLYENSRNQRKLLIPVLKYLKEVPRNLNKTLLLRGYIILPQLLFDRVDEGVERNLAINVQFVHLYVYYYWTTLILHLKTLMMLIQVLSFLRY